MPVVVDVQTGTIGGLGLGDPKAQITGTLGAGSPYSETQGLLPTRVPDSAEVGFPYSVDPPRRGERFQQVVAGVVRYPYVTFQTTPEVGVYAVTSAARALETKEGVRVGDRLSRAREVYPGLRCAIRNEGSENPTYPYCAGRTGKGVYVWFGQDPIRSISLATKPMG